MHNAFDCRWMEDALRGGLRTIDFLVDGRSMRERFIGHTDLCGVFAASARSESNAATAAAFLGEAPGDTEEGRIMLYVCPECGDLGCGAITFALSRKDDTCVWSDFAFENDYDAEMTDRETYANIGPFVFEANAYRSAILKVSSP